jgi:hypothetical protein
MNPLSKPGFTLPRQIGGQAAQGKIAAANFFILGETR